MEPFTIVEGRAAPLPAANIDTDVIMPKRFLKGVDRSGLAVVYEPGARVRHRVEADRLTPEWIVARFAAQGFSEAIVDWKHFGARGVGQGLARQRRAVQHHARVRGRSDLLVLGHRAALRAYRNGALYAAIAVPRWDPAP